MNLPFADISGAVLSMVATDPPKSDIPAKVLDDSDQPASDVDLQKFSDNLSEQMEKTKEIGQKIPAPAESQAPDQTKTQAQAKTAVKEPVEADEEITQMVADVLESDTGIGFLDKLKQVMLKLSGGDLDSLTIDEEGLDALKKLLVMAGFKEEDIEALVDSLEDTLQADELVLGDFMDQLFDLPLETSETASVLADEYLLETSALPYLESMMAALQIPPEQVEAILAEASRGNKGVSLDVVIEKLQAIETQALSGSVQFKTGSDGTEAFKQQMAQLGLAVPDTTASSPVSLTDFVAALDSLARQTTAVQEPGTAAALSEKPVDIIDALFKGLSRNTQAPSAEMTVTGSFEEIKEQFKYEFMVQTQKGGDAETAKSGTLLNTMLAETKADSVPKELAALMSKQEDATAQVKSSLKEARAVGSTAKGETVKPGEENIVSLSSLKQAAGSNSPAVGKNTPLLKNLPTHVTQQVTKGIVRAVNQGENTLKIQLKPPELGRLLMTIDNQGNSMKVSIITESQAAKEVLAANVNELKTVLAGSGISLDQFDVDMNSDFRQSMADAKGQSGQFNQKGKNKSNTVADGVNTHNSMNDPVQAEDGSEADGSYHFVA